MKVLLVQARPGAVVPREGMNVRAAGGAITDAEPVRVPASSYYRRRLADGDLVLAAEPQPARARPAASTPAAAGSES